MEMSKELVTKAKEAKNPEELMALAKENGVELTEESAKAYFEQLNPKTGEVSDDELNNVAGGGCHNGDGRMITTVLNDCRHWLCKYDGEEYPRRVRRKYFRVQEMRFQRRLQKLQILFLREGSVALQ